MNGRYVELDLQIIKITREAVLFSDGTQEVWIPLSTINEDDVTEIFDSEEGETITIRIIEWTAIKKGLV
jgi:hypothetical protein